MRFYLIIVVTFLSCCNYNRQSKFLNTIDEYDARLIVDSLKKNDYYNLFLEYNPNISNIQNYINIDSSFIKCVYKNELYSIFEIKPDRNERYYYVKYIDNKTDDSLISSFLFYKRIGIDTSMNISFNLNDSLINSDILTHIALIQGVQMIKIIFSESGRDYENLQYLYALKNIVQLKTKDVVENYVLNDSIVYPDSFFNLVIPEWRYSQQKDSLKYFIRDNSKRNFKFKREIEDNLLSHKSNSISYFVILPEKHLFRLTIKSKKSILIESLTGFDLWELPYMKNLY